MRVVGFLLALLLSAPFLVPTAPPAWAVEPDEILDDPVLEARAREISQGVRCLVCQNESIDSSNAGLARDLRILVRERLVAGDGDDEVRAFLVARYGDFVLFDPPVKPETYLLWFGPAAMLLLGLGGVLFYFSRRQTGSAEAAPLNDAERARLQRLLEPESDAGADRT